MAPKRIALAAVAAIVLVLALALILWCRHDGTATVHVEPVPPRLGSSLSLHGSPAPRLECKRPRSLRLARFEDGSARLECGRRLLVRVSVPN